LSEYVFDKKYFEKDVCVDEDDYDDNRCMTFKMTSDEGPALYLTIFNCHNGYYTHGFEFKDGEELIKEGGL